MLIQADKSLLFRHNCGIMHRRIGDNATPKTGGVTNRAYPTVTLRFELGISNFGLVSDFGFPPICRGVLYETNPIPAYPWRLAGFPTPNMRNKPNPAPILFGVPLPGRIGAGNEPNLIPPRAPCLLPRASFMRNEPNLPCPPTTQICETNPITKHLH